MRIAIPVMALLIGASAVCAQDGGSAKPAGLEADWEIAAVLHEISLHAQRLGPMLERFDANQWVQKGASQTYVAQLQSCREQATALARGAEALTANPQQLSGELEIFFRMQSLETMLGSLEEGMRKYHSQADAQALAVFEAQDDANRDRLQRYIVNLAAQREQEFKVMDREAQRCRGLVIQAPPRGGRKK